MQTNWGRKTHRKALAVKQRNNTRKPVCTLYGRCGLNQARAYPTSRRHILLSLGSKQMQGYSWQIINLLLSSQDVLLFQCKSWFLRPRDKGSGLRMTRCQLPLLARGSRDSSALCASPVTALSCFPVWPPISTAFPQKFLSSLLFPSGPTVSTSTSPRLSLQDAPECMPVLFCATTAPTVTSTGQLSTLKAIGITWGPATRRWCLSPEVCVSPKKLHF